MKYKTAVFLTVCVFNLTIVKSLNILTVVTLISPSHQIFVDNLLLSLVEKGHNVTLFGFEADKHNHPNYTFIQMKGVYEKFQDQHDYLEFKNYNNWQNIQLFWSALTETCQLCFETDGMKQITSYPKNYKFDIILWDVLSGPCLYPLISKFGDPPVIGVNAYVMQPNLFGNVHQGFVPFMSFNSKNQLSYFERLQNNFWWALMEITKEYQLFPEHTRLAKDYFGDDIRPLEEVARNFSLLLTNYNPALNFVRALPPNIIPIGGIHIKSKKLPPDVRQILENAKHGVVCFSLGTNIKSSTIGEKNIQAFLKVFGKLKQTVIWKFEDENLANVPKNVIVKKWLPLSGILEHPNTKLFIFHGGMLSLHEAAHYGVPIVIIPFLLDQFKNVATIVSRKIGETIDFDMLNEEIIHATISKVLNNKNYTENAKKLSKLYKDYPQTPLERAHFWIEYVHRHGGAHHFDLPTRDMSFIQNSNFDILLTFALILFISVVIVFKILKKVLRIFVSICFSTKTIKNSKLD